MRDLPRGGLNLAYMWLLTLVAKFYVIRGKQRREHS